jgi:HEAT repeat protein
MDKPIGLIAFRYLPFARVWIMEPCLALDPKHHTDVLLLALKDRKKQVRIEAIRLILKRKEWKAVNLMPLVLKDSDADVRLAAVLCLIQFGSPSTADHLYSVLKDPIPLIKAEAVGALKKFPKTRYQPGVQELALDRDANVQLAALETLLLIHCTEDFVFPLLNLALDHRRSHDIHKLAFANIRQAERLPLALIERLEQACKSDDSIGLHLEAVKILAAYPPGKEMQAALLQFLHHISIDVHRLVVQALGEKGDRTAIYFLNTIVWEGKKDAQLMNRYDSRLAEIAIEKINRRHPY